MPFFSGSLNISGSIISTGVITSNGSPVITSNTTSSFVIDTGSFATTGSNTFIGNQTISGSVTSTGGFTGSLLGTATTSTTSSYALSGSYTFNPYENIFTFSQSLEGIVETGQEFIVEISGSNSGSIYFGSMQVYSSQSVDKPVYVTQNDGYVSNVTDNDYIVL